MFDTEEKVVETVSKDVDSIWSQIGFITNSILDGVFVVDLEGKVLMVNRAYERITGISAETVLGNNIVELEKQRLFTPIH